MSASAAGSNAGGGAAGAGGGITCVRSGIAARMTASSSKFAYPSPSVSSRRASTRDAPAVWMRNSNTRARKVSSMCVVPRYGTRPATPAVSSASCAPTRCSASKTGHLLTTDPINPASNPRSSLRDLSPRSRKPCDLSSSTMSRASRPPRSIAGCRVGDRYSTGS